jgi:hypothetical protein
MYKNSYFIIVITLICILCSCKKEEIFSPSKYILTESKQESSDMKLTKEFNYAGKELVSVYLTQEKITLTFEYNSDKTVKKITSSKNGSYALMEYDDKRISQIQYYENGKLTHENKFYRKEKKNTINKIETYTYDGFSSEGILLKMLFPESKSVPETVQKSHKDSGGSLYAVRNVTYEGDNINRVRFYYVTNGKEIEYYATSYQYDDKKNPYYGLPYAFLDLTGYSKNNVSSSTMSYEYGKDKEDQKVQTVQNTYSYEKKYPTYNTILEYTTYIIGHDTAGVPIFHTDTKNKAAQYTYK